MTLLTGSSIPPDVHDAEYRLEARLDAYAGEERVFGKTWDRRVPRDLA